MPSCLIYAEPTMLRPRLLSQPWSKPSFPCWNVKREPKVSYVRFSRKRKSRPRRRRPQKLQPRRPQVTTASQGQRLQLKKQWPRRRRLPKRPPQLQTIPKLSWPILRQWPNPKSKKWWPRQPQRLLSPCRQPRLHQLRPLKQTLSSQTRHKRPRLRLRTR